MCVCRKQIYMQCQHNIHMIHINCAYTSCTCTLTSPKPFGDRRQERCPEHYNLYRVIMQHTNHFKRRHRTSSWATVMATVLYCKTTNTVRISDPQVKLSQHA